MLYTVIISINPGNLIGHWRSSGLRKIIEFSVYIKVPMKHFQPTHPYLWYLLGSSDGFTSYSLEFIYYVLDVVDAKIDDISIWFPIIPWTLCPLTFYDFPNWSDNQLICKQIILKIIILWGYFLLFLSFSWLTAIRSYKIICFREYKKSCHHTRLYLGSRCK